MNITVFPLTAVWTIIATIIAPIAVIYFKIVKQWRLETIIRKFVWCYGRVWQVIISPFVRMELESFEKEQFPNPSILIVNHLSFFDTFFMNQLPCFDVCFAVRAWPFRILFYRPFMLMGKYLNVESLSWEEISGNGRDVLSKNGYILFFPEGHRSRNGRLNKFYSGAFKLSVESGVPIIPICITGTDQFFPPDRKWFEPATIKLKNLGIFYPEDYGSYLPHVQMKRQIHTLMREHIQGTGKER